MIGLAGKLCNNSCGNNGYVATKLTGYSGSKPESVTGIFVYLASEESNGVTGKMLSSSGWKTN
jgi:hypothetical protein